MPLAPDFIGISLCPGDRVRAGANSAYRRKLGFVVEICDTRVLVQHGSGQEWYPRVNVSYEPTAATILARAYEVKIDAVLAHRSQPEELQ